MAKPHIPDLNALEALENQEIRFFAIIGAVMSLSASLEIAYFDVFQKATKLPPETAAAIFYEIINTSTRRDMAGKALSASITDPILKSEWTNLYSRIIAATGNASHRNLLGHGQVSKTVTTSGGCGMLGFGPLGGGPLGSAGTVKEEYHVKQDATQILAGKKKPQQADFDESLNFCREVIALIADLDSFLNSF